MGRLVVLVVLVACAAPREAAVAPHSPPAPTPAPTIAFADPTLARAMADRSDVLHARHLGEVRAVAAEPTGDLAAATEVFQREQVRAALRACDGSKTAAAAKLGVSRQWLHKLVARWEQDGVG